MIWLTSARGPGEPPLAIDATKVIGLEMVLETRGGVVYKSFEGTPTSIGTKVYLVGRAEPLVVLEHLPQVEKIVEQATGVRPSDVEIDRNGDPIPDFTDVSTLTYGGAKVAATDHSGRTIREDELAANPDIRDARPRE